MTIPWRRDQILTVLEDEVPRTALTIARAIGARRRNVDLVLRWLEAQGCVDRFYTHPRCGVFWREKPWPLR